jgi:hypothetical protein
MNPKQKKKQKQRIPIFNELNDFGWNFFKNNER